MCVRQLNDETGRVEMDLSGGAFTRRLERALLAKSWYGPRLLQLPFHEAHEYLFLLRDTALAVAVGPDMGWFGDCSS